MLLAAAAGADRGILPLLRAVLGPDELFSLVTIALLGSYANDLVRLCVDLCNFSAHAAYVCRWFHVSAVCHASSKCGEEARRVVSVFHAL
jgi:hypothetical protein